MGQKKCHPGSYDSRYTKKDRTLKCKTLLMNTRCLAFGAPRFLFEPLAARTRIGVDRKGQETVFDGVKKKCPRRTRGRGYHASAGDVVELFSAQRPGAFLCIFYAFPSKKGMGRLFPLHGRQTKAQSSPRFQAFCLDFFFSRSRRSHFEE